MLWAQVAPLLKDAITSVALEPGAYPVNAKFGARWQNQKAEFVSPLIKAEILLSLGKAQRSAFGYTDTYNAATNKVDRALKATHTFVLHVQVRSFDQTECNWSYEYAERIRTRIDRDDVYNKLLAANIVVVEDLGIVQADGVIDGREVSIANLDLRIRCAFEDATYPIDWIEKVQISGTVFDGPTALPPIPPVTIP